MFSHHTNDIAPPTPSACSHQLQHDEGMHLKGRQYIAMTGVPCTPKLSSWHIQPPTSDARVMRGEMDTDRPWLRGCVQDVAPRMAVDVQEHVQDQGLGEHHGKHSGYPQGFYGPSDKSSRAHAHAKV